MKVVITGGAGFIGSNLVERLLAEESVTEVRVLDDFSTGLRQDYADPRVVVHEGDLRDAAPKLLRYRLWQLPARLTRGQRKQWLHLRTDWPWTTDVINTWQAVKAIPAPT